MLDWRVPQGSGVGWAVSGWEAKRSGRLTDMKLVFEAMTLPGLSHLLHALKKVHDSQRNTKATVGLPHALQAADGSVAQRPELPTLDVFV